MRISDWSSDVCSSDLAVISARFSFDKTKSASVNGGRPPIMISLGQGRARRKLLMLATRACRNTGGSPRFSNEFLAQPPTFGKACSVACDRIDGRTTIREDEAIGRASGRERECKNGKI